MATNHPEKTSSNLASMAGLALTSVALVLEPITGVASLIARIAALGAAVAGDNEIEKLGERTNSLESRTAALEQAQMPIIRLSGIRLQLLAVCLHRESTELFKYVDADEAIAALNITPSEYREAAEELQTLGLSIIDRNVNHPSGIRRARLKPIAYLSTAPGLLLDVDLPGELRKVFDVLRSAPKEQYLIPVSRMIIVTGIPLARLDLILRALVDRGVVEGHGMGSDEWGSYMDVRVTPKGRRVLRGEDAV